MSKFYVYKNNVKEGPFSLSDLKLVTIYENTLVWKVGDENWREASEYEELRDLIEPSPPEIPADKIGYDKVEDLAAVNYKPAAILSVLYILANVFMSEFMLTTKIGLILNGGIPFVIWWYFKRFFSNLNDVSTAKFINWVFAGYAIFAPLLMYTLFNGWDVRLGRTIGEFIFNLIGSYFSEDYESMTSETESLIFVSKFVIYSFGVIIICLWVAGIKILTVNSRYTFPLKRIALSTMIFIPIHMFYLLGYAVVDEVPDSDFVHLIAMIPYILLAIHFYRADKEDATPN